MATTDAFWAGFWESLVVEEGGRGTPDGILTASRLAAAMQLVAQYGKDGVSLFTIAWAAHMLATAEAATATLMSRQQFQWRQRLGCLAVLESACACENGCLPETAPSLDCGVEKSKSPFFPLLVQSALSALHEVMKEMPTDEMNDSEHIDLAAALRQCQGKVAISGYRNALMDRLFQDWRRFDAPPHRPTRSSSFASSACG